MCLYEWILLFFVQRQALMFCFNTKWIFPIWCYHLSWLKSLFIHFSFQYLVSFWVYIWLMIPMQFPIIGIKYVFVVDIPMLTLTDDLTLKLKFVIHFIVKNRIVSFCIYTWFMIPMVWPMTGIKIILLHVFPCWPLLTLHPFLN